MPDPIHNRRTIRLPGYDYAQTGGYFVTIVARGREPALGAVVNGEVVLSNQGVIAQKVWCDLPRHFANVRLDEFVIMPNHVHGIVMIVEDDHLAPGEMGGFRRGEASGILRAVPQVTSFPDASPLPHGTQSASLAAMIQNYKSVSTRRINGMQNTPGQPFWQRNYYEHIIRDEAELQRVRQDPR